MRYGWLIYDRHRNYVTMVDVQPSRVGYQRGTIGWCRRETEATLFSGNQFDTILDYLKACYPKDGPFNIEPGKHASEGA